MLVIVHNVEINFALVIEQLVQQLVTHFSVYIIFTHLYKQLSRIYTFKPVFVRLSYRKYCPAVNAVYFIAQFAFSSVLTSYRIKITSCIYL